VVHTLTEELVRQGHEVTLFASGDSITSARLIRGSHNSLREEDLNSATALHILMLEKVRRMAAAGEFDVLHSHLDYLALPVLRTLPAPTLTTMHGRLDIPFLQSVFLEYLEHPFVSITENQRQPVLWANWLATVHHGLPAERFKLRTRPGSYLAWLGRICPDKGLPAAIRVAKRTGIKLRIAAKVDPNDYEYYRDSIKPLLRDPQIEYLGEISDSEKDEFLGNALALIFLIRWPEPFGLVLIESMACGTPIIATPQGSVPELMVPGKTGFIVAGVAQACEAVNQLESFDRAACRRVFEECFTSERMAADYLRLYRRLAAETEKKSKSKLFDKPGRLLAGSA
jgi:glycosyltransferase involved in cell wall biosynthesis